MKTPTCPAWCNEPHTDPATDTVHMSGSIGGRTGNVSVGLIVHPGIPAVRLSLVTFAPAHAADRHNDTAHVASTDVPREAFAWAMVLEQSGAAEPAGRVRAAATLLEHSPELAVRAAGGNPEEPDHFDVCPTCGVEWPCRSAEAAGLVELLAEQPTPIDFPADADERPF